MPYYGRSLPVSLSGDICLSNRSYNPIFPICSWEFFVNLDYEWSVIRGRRPYRWTIWVCNDMRYYLVLLPKSGPGTNLHLFLGILPYACGDCGDNSLKPRRP